MDKIWLIGTTNGDRRLMAISELPVRVGDVVQMEIRSAYELVLGEVVAAIETERNSELHKWIIAATGNNVTQRNVVKVWQSKAE